jgi:hypothetical protein
LTFKTVGSSSFLGVAYFIVLIQEVMIYNKTIVTVTGFWLGTFTKNESEIN